MNFSSRVYINKIESKDFMDYKIKKSLIFEGMEEIVRLLSFIYFSLFNPFFPQTIYNFLAVIISNSASNEKISRN